MPDPTYEKVQSDTLTELLNIRDSVTAGRHPKWQRVEPGTVIPAGQPYAVKHAAGVMRWSEHVNPSYSTGTYGDPAIKDWFVDSSWKPPLALPTEPTWGIAVTKHGVGIQSLGKWHRTDKGGYFTCDQGYRYHVAEVGDFIPLTDEQVARIEDRTMKHPKCDCGHLWSSHQGFPDGSHCHECRNCPKYEQAAR